MNFLDALAQRTPLLADGATGTMLQNAGLPIGEAPERWTLENPAAIRDLAGRYIAAGADLLYTNTFGASRLRLKHCGLEEKFEAVNRDAVKLAREAIAVSGREVLLVASIGPTGEMLEPYGELSTDEARQSFEEQAALLTEAGVDAFACETFMDLNETLLAVGAVRTRTKLPVMASMAFDHSNHTMMGVTPEDAVARLTDAGAAVVGANCSVGPDVVEAVARAMTTVRPQTRLLAKPNAGLPQMIDGITIYSLTPTAMASFAARMRELGVAVIGGCCGTTPEHIRAMRQALNCR